MRQKVKFFFLLAFCFVYIYIFKILILSYRCDTGSTSLHVASLAGRAEVVEMLLKKGAKVDERRTDGSTPLHLACARGHTKVVQCLIAYGADAQLRTEYRQQTPLHLACSDSRVETAEIVEILLNYGVDNSTEEASDEVVYPKSAKRIAIDEKDADGHSSLHLACIWHRPKEAEVLLKHGSDVQTVPTSGKYSRPILELLWENGWRRPYLAVAAREREHASIQVLLDEANELMARDDFMNATDEKGLTAVYYVCVAKKYNLARELLARGVRVSIRKNRQE